MAYHPANPRGTTTRTDEEGEYLAFHKICNNCQVELTSRNRAPCGSLKCMTCIGVNSRDRWRETNGWTEKPPKPPKPVPTSVDTSVPALERQAAIHLPSEGQSVHHAVSPERQAIHSLLTKFLMHSTHKEFKDNLLDALVTYEIKERFRFL